jgi:DNA mismatch repair protein MSH3
MMMAYAGHASNVRVERTPSICFGEGGALAELLSLFEESVDDASSVEGERHALAINDEDSNLHGIQVLIDSLLIIPSGF